MILCLNFELNIFAVIEQNQSANRNVIGGTVCKIKQLQRTHAAQLNLHTNVADPDPKNLHNFAGSGSRSEPS